MLNAKGCVNVEDLQHSPIHKLVRNANKTTVNSIFCGRIRV